MGVTALGAAFSAAATPHVDAPSSTALPSTERDNLSGHGADTPGPLELPTIVPTDAPVWEPAKGRVIVNGKPLPAPTVPAQASAPVAETIPPTAPSQQLDGTPAATEQTPPLVGVPDVPTPTASPAPTSQPPATRSRRHPATSTAATAEPTP